MRIFLISAPAWLLLTGCGLWSPAPPRLPDSGAMAIGEVRTAHNVNTHCGVRILGTQVAGIDWVAIDLEVDGVAPMPESWLDQVENGERIDLVIELVSQEKLLATAIGTNRTLTYAPAAEKVGCD